MAKLLIQKGADVNLKNTKDGLTPLMVAAYNGDMEMVDLLLKSKADVNAADSKGNTPLMIASANDDAEMVKWSIENGAKVNAKGGAKAEKSP